MKGLRVTLAVMLATAAVAPLAIYGVVSIATLRIGTRQTVENGNSNVARQVGEQVRRYMSTNLQIFKAVGVDIEDTDLTVAQQELILRNFVLRFPEFRELTLFGLDGRRIASSRVGRPLARTPGADAPVVMGVTMTPVAVDDDFLPATVVSTVITSRNQPVGILVGQFSIEELWRTVDRIRIGRSGVALIVGAEGELLAHGNPDDRPRVARGERLSNHPAIRRLASLATDVPVSVDATSPRGERLLSVGVRVADLGWFVLVEQPYAEAFALAQRQERELQAVIAVALLIMVVAGLFWARTLITPISALTRATRSLAGGAWQERVDIGSGGEIGELGRAFNTMAERLVQLQDDVRKQERHAVFGRVAAGLVHDLSHPFKNVQNNCKLMLKMHDDPEYRELFGRTVEREFSTVRRVFDDLRNIAKPMPMERFPLDLNAVARDTAESARANASEAGLHLATRVPDGELVVAGDRFALGRVCRNLIVNAIEATPAGGTVTIETIAEGGLARLAVRDTGCGIPPERLATLFEDFTTTKRQGLGLGLAICRKIVDQLGGTIRAESAVGVGTTFVVELPIVNRQASHADTPAA